MKKNLLFFVLIIISSYSLSAQVNLPLGLKAYYPFTGNANDVSGNNNNPVFNNATLTADRLGNPNSAYHFNGTNTYMKILNNPTINMVNTMSVALWVKPMGFYTGPCHNNMIVMKGDADQTAGNYSTRFTAEPTQGCVSNPDLTTEIFWGPNAIPPDPFVQLNRWYSVIWTNDGITAKIYIDCVLKGSFPATVSSFTNAYDLYFGRMNNVSFPYWLNGDLDEIRIYNRALNQDEVNVLGDCVIPVACNNWLSTPTDPSYVTAGDIDVNGNQLTVEAVFNRTAPPPVPGSYGFLLSKHLDAFDNNYAMWPNGCALTTSTQAEAFALANCDIELNKTYHVAMVYDGATLKFYRNGFLHSQTPITGNLVTNNLLTHIASNPPGSTPFQFLGNMNEVRIWNVARTEVQVQSYMNSSLPNPTITPGLLAYYTFDNLLNKQGNAAFNATLNGGATINATNPNCTFIADSCAVTQASVIINNYTPVLALKPCNNTLTVENGTAYNVGDTVLLIQMKGAVIDSTNTAAFGTITDYKNSGNYEFNYVKSKTGNIIELKNVLTRQYDIPVGKVQLIRVPYYINLTTTDTLTCLPWDGNKGGVLVFNVQNTLTLNADLNVSGKGFKGGIGYNPGNASLSCFQNNYFYPINTIQAAYKGESISSISTSKICGKGNLAGGGGGGAGHNSGGGGGGNGGVGGFGGYQLDNCGSAPFDNRGIGGRQLAYSTASNRIFMGSGGGAGHADNPGNIPPAGGNGAGIIIVNADKIQSNSKKIIANGDNGLACSVPSSPDCHDAMGGGGAGGTVLLSVNQYLDNSIVENKGGKGADVVSANISIAGRIGPGGGGAGGLAFLKAASLPANLTIANAGGLNGVLTQDANNPWGATPGAAGQNLFNLVLPVDNVLFKTNIDSVRIKDSILSCNNFDFKGLAYINTAPIATWQWYFGDGGQANAQNTSHAYGAAGLYTVKLIVTDINGCIDSTLKDVNALPAVTSNAGADVSICSNTTVSVTLNGTAVGGPYLWSPAIYLNNPNIQNPIATISSTTIFYLNVVGSATCTAIDSVTIYINPVPLVNTRPDTNICRLSPLVLNTNSNATTFQWSPAGDVSNPTIASPNYTGNASGWVYVTGYFASGCSATDSLYVTVNPVPFVDARTDTAICLSSPLVLNTNSNATTFQWSPAASVSNPTIANPNYIGNISGWVYVTGYFASGCSSTDSLYVTVNPVPFVDARTDTAICLSSPLILNTNSDATTFQWSPAASVSNPTIASPNYISNASGWVYVTGYFAAGCFAKDSLYITVNPLPVVQTIADTTLCQSVNITLTTTGAQTYSWNPAIGLSNATIASPVFIGNSGQTYTVTGTDANGCKNNDLVTISIILPGTFKAPPAFTICQKQSVQLDGNNGTQVSYLWSPATYLSNATIINPIANPPQTTVYTLLITDNRCGYDSTFTTLLTVVPAPFVNARKSNDIDCAFRSATIFASGGNQYLWSPSAGLSSTTIPNPVARPTVTQKYTVLVIDANGCFNNDSVTVIVNNTASLARYMPNAFTPNGDGKNDCYGLRNWMYIQNLKFFIFNRYGEQVFATANPNSCWDGTYKGKPALAGTYVYVIQANTLCGLEEQKGNFILLR
jgi:gliding motility-associated-like protein